MGVAGAAVRLRCIDDCQFNYNLFCIFHSRNSCNWQPANVQRATCNSLAACGRHFGTLFNLFEVFSVCGNLFWFVSPFTSGLICVAVFQLGFHRFDRLFFTRAPTGKEQITVMFKIIKNI